MRDELAASIPPEEICVALEIHVFGPTKIRVFREDDELRSFPY
jgi:hypothetical protein